MIHMPSRRRAAPKVWQMTFSMNFLLYRIFQCGNRKEEKGESVRSLPESLRGVHALNFWRGGFFAFANSAWGRLTNARMSEHKERKTLEERHQMSDLERLRHSCAHVLATAICRLWPDAQLAGGPAVDNGFYYDVELDHRISTEDFERIEEEMKKVVKENQPFQKEVISRAEAMKMAESGELGALGPRSEPSRFKIDLLNDIPEDEEISLFRNGDFTDLCAGPHVGRTGNCKAFKVMSVASAFYKGDKNRPMLQRIYGTCFPNRTQLDEHLERLEEARRRDHRKLGRELGLFCIDEAVGQGLILWKPKGALIRRSLQDFITQELDKLGLSLIHI